MPLTRRQNAQYKVYLPASARETQYLLAKFDLSDELLEAFADKIDMASDQPYRAFYETLSELFFNIAHELDIDCGQFVANDKFLRVRFCEELLTPQTKQQLFFLYNPRYHSAEKSYFDPTVRAQKIKLLFLANGEQVRLDAAKFHKKVSLAISRFAERAGLKKTPIRVCDHQHLTFDLFAQEKGIGASQTHKFRTIPLRYMADDIELPEHIEPVTYVVADIPLNRRMRSLVDINLSDETPYKPLYEMVEKVVFDAAKETGIKNIVISGNGMVPVVRFAEEEQTDFDGELLRIGTNPSLNSERMQAEWDGKELENKVQVVFIANNAAEVKRAYGRFYQIVEKTLKIAAASLDFVNEKEEIKVRFHQHVGYMK